MVLALAILALSATGALASDPVELRSWRVNSTGLTGYHGLPVDVQSVDYTPNWVYVSASGIPDYPIGPWYANPNDADSQTYVYRIPRIPAAGSVPPDSTPVGPIGAWINGVPMFNPLDGHSYNDLDVWHQNAGVIESKYFDTCDGHPNEMDAYHHHSFPVCLTSTDPTRHSPILGFAFDGYPVYGPYGYRNTDGTGGIVRMQSSFQLRTLMTQRKTLPGGAPLTMDQWGPDVSTTYPLGYYVEDYAYMAGSGDLDVHNGRFGVTPEYPLGIYAYYTTLDDTLGPAYPYVLGPSYFGGIGPDAYDVHQVLPPVYTHYGGTTGVDAPDAPGVGMLRSHPNPARASTTIGFVLREPAEVSLSLYDVAGRPVARLAQGRWPAGPSSVELPCTGFAPGVYFLRMRAGPLLESHPLLIVR